VALVGVRDGTESVHFALSDMVLTTLTYNTCVWFLIGYIDTAAAISLLQIS